MTANVALVHDWLTAYGGAERVLLEMHRLYPSAPVYTSLWKPEAMPPEFAGMRIQPSFLQKLPRSLRRQQALLPLMPLAFESFDLEDCQLVLSSSHACAKGVLTGPETVHIAYLHTSMRYAWDMTHAYLRASGMGALKQALARASLHYLRIWDQLNTGRIDHLLCNSHFVRKRIAKYYGRDATVLYPPVDVPTALPERRPEDFYLAVGRHVPYKRVDLIIESFAGTKRRLKIAGQGPETARLKALAPANVEFLGEVSRSELESLYSRAKALLFAPLEDFGIVPVEAQAYGCPVIAYGHGGALETVVNGDTGLFFAEQRAASLREALDRFEAQETAFSPTRLHTHASKFAARHFSTRLQSLINQALP